MLFHSLLAGLLFAVAVSASAFPAGKAPSRCCLFLLCRRFSSLFQLSFTTTRLLILKYSNHTHHLQNLQKAILHIVMCRWDVRLPLASSLFTLHSPLSLPLRSQSHPLSSPNHSSEAKRTLMKIKSPFNCCVTYIRDPCSEHQIPKYPPLEKCTGADDFDCKCRCEKYPE